MPLPLRTLVISAAAIVLVPSITCGAVTAWTDVVVRIYDAHGAVTGTNREALDRARKTLEAASVDVIWRHCHGAPSPCDAPMAPGELAIRIVRAPVPGHYRGSLPLGDAFIDAHGGDAVLATIYFDRVAWLAKAAGADLRLLLARAIAHELGHLLLANATHGPHGLMRAMWSQNEVRRGHSRDWMFVPRELEAIRARVDARKATGHAARDR
jgi:hypothetical protein